MSYPRVLQIIAAAVLSNPPLHTGLQTPLICISTTPDLELVLFVILTSVIVVPATIHSVNCITLTHIFYTPVNFLHVKQGPEKWQYVHSDIMYYYVKFDYDSVHILRRHRACLGTGKL